MKGMTTQLEPLIVSLGNLYATHKCLPRIRRHALSQRHVFLSLIQGQEPDRLQIEKTEFQERAIEAKMASVYQDFVPQRKSRNTSPLISAHLCLAIQHLCILIGIMISMQLSGFRFHDRQGSGMKSGL
jgi:hypothetical protein